MMGDIVNARRTIDFKKFGKDFKAHKNRVMAIRKSINS